MLSKIEYFTWVNEVTAENHGFRFFLNSIPDIFEITYPFRVTHGKAQKRGKLYVMCNHILAEAARNVEESPEVRSSGFSLPVVRLQSREFERRLVARGIPPGSFENSVELMSKYAINLADDLNDAVTDGGKHDEIMSVEVGDNEIVEPNEGRRVLQTDTRDDRPLGLYCHTFPINFGCDLCMSRLTVCIVLEYNVATILHFTDNMYHNLSLMHPGISVEGTSTYPSYG